MKTDLADLNAFIAVARAGGFRGAARSNNVSASGLSEAVRRLETHLGVRLLHRTTRSVTPTEAGQRLFERLVPAMQEVESALDIVNGFRDQPMGTLRLNVAVGVARLVLPDIVPDFLAAYPGLRLEVIAEDNFVDVVATGCDAGIRYEERLEQDMIAVPIGPRVQRFAAAASSSYLAVHGRPAHPRELVGHVCMRTSFSSGAIHPWEFERDDEVVRVDPPGRLLVRAGTASDLAIASAVVGIGVIYHFESWLRPYLDGGALEPVLEPWWPRFSGPYLYYPGRRFVPAPLRAFIDFVRARGEREGQ
ncbi:DNA-binding transcriptional LysR family regulator OS=Castellaniella defragrans OX=75697 GN=HNR28_001944 PE=3 SV=1 [Castellaniella defragrans]